MREEVMELGFGLDVVMSDIDRESNILLDLCTWNCG